MVGTELVPGAQSDPALLDFLDFGGISFLLVEESATFSSSLSEYELTREGDNIRKTTTGAL